MKLLKILKETITEIKVTPKDIYGQGVSHKVYVSLKDPNKLFKVLINHKDQDFLGDWIEIFKDNPTLFPKVFRHNKFGAEVEKLDSKKATKEYVELESFIDELYKYGTFRNLLSDVYDKKEDKEFINKIGKILHTNEPFMFQTFIKFIQLIKNISKTTNIKHLDMHSHNFGYDNKGKLKMLDI